MLVITLWLGVFFRRSLWIRSWGLYGISRACSLRLRPRLWVCIAFVGWPYSFHWAIWLRCCMSSWRYTVCACNPVQLILTVSCLAVGAGFAMRLESDDMLLLTVLQGAARHRWSSLQSTNAVALLDERAALYSVNHTLSESQSCHVSSQACMLAW